MPRRRVLIGRMGYEKELCQLAEVRDITYVSMVNDEQLRPVEEVAIAVSEAKFLMMS